MLFLRKSKKGFTLIELMVVVVIIGVLAVLGLRAYSGQVDKAKNAVIKANVGTIQTLIQGELADSTVDAVNTDVNTDDNGLISRSGIHNPFTGEAQAANGTEGADGLPGDVYVLESGGIFSINGNNADESPVYDDSLTASK
ncbi:hypothetical protein ES705_13187 [subsurface metagenome]|nr:prepilin-type N-terminal cleavage/methylation domain-containing protein [Clostridia bacterium]